LSDVIATVPARPEYMRILRAVVASVAARLDFTYDRIEDLRLAIDEACAQLLGIPAEARNLTVRLTSKDGRMVAYACTDAEPGAGAWPPPDVESSFGWRILSSLADQADFLLGEDGPAIRMTIGVMP
jgi:serine/threonine-protein kinase RsbW